MTVKINNQNLQAAYNSVQQNFIDGDTTYNAYQFLGKTDAYDGTKEEFITIVSAIINEEPILFGQPEYKIRVKGLGNADLNHNFLKYCTCEKVFELGTPEDIGSYQTNFKKSWLINNWPEFDVYNAAELLEFVEVEDD